jgi:hypothetical protein
MLRIDKHTTKRVGKILGIENNFLMVDLFILFKLGISLFLIPRTLF